MSSDNMESERETPPFWVSMILCNHTWLLLQEYLAILYKTFGVIVSYHLKVSLSSGQKHRLPFF